MDIRNRDPRDVLVANQYCKRILAKIHALGLRKADVGRVYNGDRDARDPGDIVRHTLNGKYTQKLSSLIRMHLAVVITAATSDVDMPVVTVVNHRNMRTTFEQWAPVVPGHKHLTCSQLTGEYMGAVQQMVTTMIHEAGYTADTLVGQLGYRKPTARILTGEMAATWDYSYVALRAVARSVEAEFMVL